MKNLTEYLDKMSQDIRDNEKALKFVWFRVDHGSLVWDPVGQRIYYADKEIVKPLIETKLEKRINGFKDMPGLLKRVSEQIEIELGISGSKS